MIFLTGISDLDERNHEYSRGEVYSRAEMDASDILQNFSVKARYLFIVVPNRVKAIINIVFICVSAYLIILI